MNIFEKAAKNRLRFETDKGSITVEDLWDVPLESRGALSLDNIARGLNREINLLDSESFVSKKTTVNDLLELKFSIVKHIIECKLKSAETAEKAEATRQQRERIRDIIAQKQDQVLLDTDVAELEKMLEDSSDS